MAEKVIYARAQPENVSLMETYFYRQEISLNPYRTSQKSPIGRIEVVVPYDGYQYFTRQACKDVEQQGGTDISQGKTDALIGYLVLANYGQTDLKDLLAPSDRYVSIPLRVPIAGSGITNLDQLQDDQHTCVIASDYSPHWPDVIPIEIKMELLDEDMLSLPSVELSTEEGIKSLGDVVAQIAQQVSFRRNLMLITQIKLNLPCKFLQDNLEPKITRISLSWPTITSFRALHLLVGRKEIPVTYNPLTRSLEWANVSMKRSEKSEGTDLEIYISDEMLLLIDQPGELYQQVTLDGQVEIEIPGLLLSGLQVRLYNGVGELTHNLTLINAMNGIVDTIARGNLPPGTLGKDIDWRNELSKRQLALTKAQFNTDSDDFRKSSEQIQNICNQIQSTIEDLNKITETIENIKKLVSAVDQLLSLPRVVILVTRVVTNLKLILDDAFTKRTRSPYQHLYFDEIIPDAMRIADIKTALVDQGFRIDSEQDISLSSGHDVKYFILARRPEGPDTMELWIFVDGKRYTTERQSQVAGGQTYTSTFESGELNVYIRGALPGDSRRLIQEMNALQIALRDRFGRLRAKR